MLDATPEGARRSVAQRAGAFEAERVTKPDRGAKRSAFFGGDVESQGTCDTPRRLKDLRGGA
ncbi:MAG TPA: hypothetical protein VEF03_05415 [Candidatus Binataceae bacterium]|nr:hypothetical protein [Candidatus Binataceae bacterium]